MCKKNKDNYCYKLCFMFIRMAKHSVTVALVFLGIVGTFVTTKYMIYKDQQKLPVHIELDTVKASERASRGISNSSVAGPSNHIFNSIYVPAAVQNSTFPRHLQKYHMQGRLILLTDSEMHCLLTWKCRIIEHSLICFSPHFLLSLSFPSPSEHHSSPWSPFLSLSSFLMSSIPSLSFISLTLHLC